MPKHSAAGAQNAKAKNIFDWCGEIVTAVVFVVLLFTFVFRVVTVKGPSMLPNLVGEDRLIIAGIHTPLKQGDVVVVVNVLEDPIIKRVIATENQTVDIDYASGTVYVDGKAVDESLFDVENGITTLTNNGLAKTQLPLTVPEGCIFVLGDNRTVSVDSRYQQVGVIDERNVLGKAVLRIFPLQKFGLV